MNKAWLSLLVAGLFEVCWPVGFKLSQTPGRLATGVALALAGMALSGWFLWLAQKDIPMGTAYAVWTGIGAAGTFAVGVFAYGETMGLLRLGGVAFIITGVALLKLAS